jgi:hypothetical protein
VRNSVNLAQVREMTAQQVADLPIDLLAGLLEDLAALKAEASATTEKLSAALNLKYASRAAELRREAGKDTGTVTIQEDGYIVRADLPKAVEWSEFGLREVERKLVEMGEPVDEYIVTTRKVPERAYAAWPSGLRAMFEPHRIVGTGRPSFKVERRAA